jgi:hypothetical protein
VFTSVDNRKTAATPGLMVKTAVSNISLPHRNLARDKDSYKTLDTDFSLSSDEDEIKRDEEERGIGEQKGPSQDEEEDWNYHDDVSSSHVTEHASTKGKKNIKRDRFRGKGKSKARIKNLLPLSGTLLNESEDEVGEESLAELTELLNDEITFSCFDIDLKIDSDSDDVSERSDTDSNSDGDCDDEVDLNSRIQGDLTRQTSQSKVTNSWTDSPNGRTSPGKRLAKFSESINIPKPRNKPTEPLSVLRRMSITEAEAVMVIETVRPFASSGTLKKPIKRLNFIAQPSTIDRRWSGLAPLESSGSRDYDSSPDLFSNNGFPQASPPDIGNMDKFSPFPEIKTENTSIYSPDPLPFGSAGGKVLKRQSFTGRISQRDSSASPLEDIYDQQSDDRERFEFNPLKFPGSSLSGSRKNSIIERTNKSVPLPSAPSESVPLKKSVTIAREVTPDYLHLHPDIPVVKVTSKPSRPIVSPNLIPSPPSSFSSGFNANSRLSSNLSNTKENAQKVIEYLSPSPYRKNDRKGSTSLKKRNGNHINNKEDADLLRSVESQSRHQRRGLEPGLETSTYSNFSFFSLDSVQSAIDFLLPPEEEEEESREDRRGKCLKSDTVNEEVEQQMVRNNQNNFEREKSGNSGKGIVGYNSPQSLYSSQRSAHDSKVSFSNNYHSSQHSQDMSSSARVGKEVWKTVSSILRPTNREGRGISAEEEMADRLMESEIDTFIEQDELSPIILREYGIEMGIKEMNGIRQNAVRSLPALLNSIEKGMVLNTTGGEEVIEGYVDNYSGKGLELWGAAEGDASLSQMKYLDLDEDHMEATRMGPIDEEEEEGEYSDALPEKIDDVVSSFDDKETIVPPHVIVDEENEVKVSDSIERLISMGGITKGNVLDEYQTPDTSKPTLSHSRSYQDISRVLYDEAKREKEEKLNLLKQPGSNDQKKVDLLKEDYSPTSLVKGHSESRLNVTVDSGLVGRDVDGLFDMNGSSLIKKRRNSSDSNHKLLPLTPSFLPLTPAPLLITPTPLPRAITPPPALPLSLKEAEELILHGEARLAWAAQEAGTLKVVSKDLAISLMFKIAEDPDSKTEPLEKLVLLVDKLGADVNAKDGNSMTPLHSLFNRPSLGRFVLSRGGDVLTKNDDGESVLAMCAEYGYPWVLPAFMSMHGREAKLLEDPERAHEYATVLLSLWGYGTRVRELIEEGIVEISAEEATEIMEACSGNFDNMKEPVETFELLEMLMYSEVKS